MAAVTICSDFGAQKNKERLNQTKFARLIWSLHFQCYKIAWDLLACAECKHHPRPHHAAAKSLQSCPTLCDPIDGSPPGSPVPGILQARTLEWVAIFFPNEWKWKVKVKSFSHVWPSATPWTAAFQAPPSMGFSRQEYWSRVPLPSLNVAHTVASECLNWFHWNLPAVLFTSPYSVCILHLP